MNNFQLIITLNINGLNNPIKRHRVAEWIRRHDPHIYCLQETHLRTKELHRLQVKGQKQIFQANGQEKKKQGQQYSYKIDFQGRAIKRDLDGHFITLKGRIHQEDINIVNIYVPNMGAPKYIKKIFWRTSRKILTATQLQQGTLTPHYQKWTGLPNKISTRILCHLTIPQRKWT